MPDYQELREFERCVIIGAREMGHSIFEEVMKFGYSLTTISRVYREYWESSKTSNLRHRCDRKKTFGLQTVESKVSCFDPPSPLPVQFLPK
ncbi:HTH_Tnp_Tc3_2 domain-containing protein [Trichonephila clavipes]|nr:HTH_Tnp_Tc3_2 domain-containing protein [Trichonephila clavipes]